jgi:uncharacterized DUF497 family protein
MKFEWDARKNIENAIKHGVKFEDAQKAFVDKRRKIIKDEKHSKGEARYFCYGKVEGEIVTVRFTIRKDIIRIFGAGLWRKGRKIYYGKAS